MKKTYKDPELFIKKFAAENVVTSSGQTAADSLKSQYSGVQTFEADWNTMQEAVKITL